MAATSNIYTLLRLFSNNKKRAQITFNEFCTYIQKYSQHYIAELSDLVIYLESPHLPLEKELDKLAEAGKIIYDTSDKGEKMILVTSYFKDRIVNRYKQIQENPAIPFPISSDLPRDFPGDLLINKDAADVLYDILEEADHSDSNLYSIAFKKEIPAILLPSDIPGTFLLDLSIAKIRHLMRKSEHHDYYLKKLCNANSGRELSAKNFFMQFLNKPTECLQNLKLSGDSYYFWNQLFIFIRQDYEKIKDRTQEDTALLQAISIIELACAFYKNKAQISLQRETALKNLDLAMAKPPYYYDFDAILKFTDSRGVPLLGQYSQEDLNEYIMNVTTTADEGSLPKVLTFKTDSEVRYYLNRDKALQLVMKLSSDAREIVRGQLTKEWFELMRAFKTIPAMKDTKAFDKLLEDTVRKSCPILYAILSSSFLAVIYYDAKKDGSPDTEKIKLFTDGKLIPYHDLLMLSHHSIMTDAQILLPFWYTIPILSFFIALFRNRKNRQAEKIDDEKNESKADDVNTTEKTVRQVSKKDELKNAIISVEKQLVPQDSTIDQELMSYLHDWNRILDKTARKNLTEDVNSLIRDYLRKIIRTLNASTLTADRLHSLAVTLAESPSLQKIKDQQELIMYIQLYMLRLIKNS